jgi:hypothetical protein
MPSSTSRPPLFPLTELESKSPLCPIARCLILVCALCSPLVVSCRVVPVLRSPQTAAELGAAILPVVPVLKQLCLDSSKVQATLVSHNNAFAVGMRRCWPLELTDPAPEDGVVEPLHWALV